jgi:hypothetical protein
MGTIEDELIKIGFIQNRSNNWTRGHDIVQIVRSSEFPRMRIMWREYWKDYLAIIFDYSTANGPICIIPSAELFASAFVKKKRTLQSYVNSGYYWSQPFDAEDPLSQLILSHENRWDVLSGKRGESNNKTGALPIRPSINASTFLTRPAPSQQHIEKPGINFEGMLAAFSDKHLLHLYCDLMEELRNRKIVRSGNNPVSDYGEKTVAEKMNLELSEGSNKGYDALDPKTGTRYQIKSRRVTKHNQSKQLGVIRNLEEKLFDYLVAVIFNEYLIPVELWQIPIEIISEYAKYSKHQNGHILIMSGDILRDGRIKKLL